MMNTSVKIITMIILVLLFFTTAGHSGDYLVEIFEEHYKERMIVGTGDMKVNHTWQVRTQFGNKVLILVGTDYNLRKWIRRDARKHKLWVAKVPDAGNDRFKYNMSVYMDLQQVQPVYSQKWKCDECRHGAPPIKPPPVPDEK